MHNTKKKTSAKGRNRILDWCVDLIRALFPILLVTYLLLMLVETIFEGSISSYLNTNYLLIVVIVVGVGALLTAPSKAERAKKEHLTAKSMLMIICVGLAGSAIVWYKTREIGWLSYVISAVSGGLTVLLSTLIWQGDEEAERKSDNKAVIEAEEVMKQAVRKAEDTFKSTEREAKEAKRRAIREAKEAMERAIREAKGEVNEEGNSRGS